MVGGPLDALEGERCCRRPAPGLLVSVLFSAKKNRHQ